VVIVLLFPARQVTTALLATFAFRF